MLNRPTTILVPLDGSPLAEGVLAYLHPLATPEMTELALVQVIEIWRYAFGADAYSMPYLITAAQSSAEAYLAQQREQLERLGYRVTTHVATGEAAHSILDLAQTTLADFIAMSTHGRSGFVGWALGSVAERVLQEATVPVFLVRANMPAQQPLQHILVPLDGSTLAEQALPRACALAQRTGATITLLQAIQSLGEEQGEIVFANAAVEATFAQWRADAEHYLQRVAAQLQSVGVAAAYKVIIGDPVPTILGVVADEQANLIVMTSHGRTGFQRWFYGSVANKVLHGAQCPLLFVRTSQIHADAYLGFLAATTS